MKKRISCRIARLTVIFALSMISSFSAFGAETAVVKESQIGPGFEDELEEDIKGPRSPQDVSKETENAPKVTIVRVSEEENGAESEARPAPGPSVSLGSPGESLGIFRISAYCSCNSCSGGHKYTYSGTLPKENHTISADLDRFPLGTKLYIDGIVYTVEDMGGSIVDDRLDIYFPTHETALAYGLKDVEVFTVIEPN